MRNQKRSFLLVLVPLVFLLLSSTYTEKWKSLKGSIVGVVYNEAGLTVPKAEVVILGVDYRDTLKTDGQGRFEVKKIPTGVYELRLESSNPELVVRRETAVYL